MKWLRKYNKVQNKWTNEVFPWNEEAAKDADMREVSEDEAKECAKRLLVEKAARVKSNRLAVAGKESAIVPVLNKIAPGKIDTPEEVTAKLDAELADDEPINQPIDDLDDMTARALKELIDAEDLAVAKTQPKPDLMAAIRAARVAKKAAPAPVAEKPATE